MSSYVMRDQDGNEIPAEWHSDGSCTVTIPEGVMSVRGPFLDGREWTWPVPEGVTQARVELLPGATRTKPPEFGPCGWPMIDIENGQECPDCGHRHWLIEAYGGGGSGPGL